MYLSIVFLSVSSPCSTTSPVISWPIAQGLANGISPLMTWRSEWQTPQATTKKDIYWHPKNKTKSTQITINKKSEGVWQLIKNFTFSLNKYFSSFRTRHLKLFNGNRLIGLPENNSTHKPTRANMVWALWDLQTVSIIKRIDLGAIRNTTMVERLTSSIS